MNQPAPITIGAFVRGCLLGWCAALAATVLVVGLMTVTGVLLGSPNLNDPPGDAGAFVGRSPVNGVAGAVTAIALVTLLFAISLLGGSVAGFRARRHGAAHGVGVGFLLILTLTLLAGIRAEPGSQLNAVLSAIVGRRAVDLSTPNLVVIACVVMLAGSAFGGRLGVGPRRHRRAD